MAIYFSTQNDPGKLKILEARAKISAAYCSQKSWDIDNLTIDQVMEIRALPEWKAAVTTPKAGGGDGGGE